jgi:hypothetical protein
MAAVRATATDIRTDVQELQPLLPQPTEHRLIRPLAAPHLIRQRRHRPADMFSLANRQAGRADAPRGKPLSALAVGSRCVNK